jgi:hypothetical protein
MIEHYDQVRELFALSFEDESVEGELRAGLKHPFAATFPLTQALSFWKASLDGAVHTPLLLEGYEGLSFARQCELALIWAAIGQQSGLGAARSAAAQLAANLAPLLQEQLTTLWTPEGERRGAESIELFSRAVGRNPQPMETTPFFALLEKLNLSIEVAPTSSPNYTLFKQPGAACGYAQAGRETSLGAIRFGSLRIPAFGIQAAPFSDSSGFGSDIVSSPWVRASACKETWFQFDPGAFAFSIQSLGRPGATPLYLSFYVDATECQIGPQILKPKTLSRFRGAVSAASLIRGGERVVLEADRALPVEAIPLAGDAAFWGTSFLLAFQLPPASGKLTFRLSAN